MTTLDGIQQSRSIVYRILQALYDRPLNREKLETVLGLEGGHGHLKEELGRLRGMLAGVTDWDEFTEKLNLEYTRLFEGPGAIPAPPYASFYLNGGQLMGPETIAVRRKYVTWGIASVNMGKVPDDHIALELAFMGYLSDQAGEALVNKDETGYAALLEAQIDFLGGHVLTWMPKFFSEMLRAQPDEFFTRLSKFTQAFLKEDFALLPELAAENTATEQASACT